FTPVCNSMISRATAPAGAGPSKAPPKVPASMAAPKNKTHRVRKVFLLRGQGLLMKLWGVRGAAARSPTDEPWLLRHYKVCPAILLPALFGGSAAELTFLAVADRFHPVGRDAQRNQELLG